MCPAPSQQHLLMDVLGCGVRARTLPKDGRPCSEPPPREWLSIPLQWWRPRQHLLWREKGMVTRVTCRCRTHIEMSAVAVFRPICEMGLWHPLCHRAGGVGQLSAHRCGSFLQVLGSFYLHHLSSSSLPLMKKERIHPHLTSEDAGAWGGDPTGSEAAVVPRWLDSGHWTLWPLQGPGPRQVSW